MMQKKVKGPAADEGDDDQEAEDEEAPGKGN